MKRKTLTLLLALALVVASIAPIQKASAAAKLSKTSVTLYVGKTTTIKLTGGNAKWSVKNTKIKILKQTKKSAKIKAMKKGTTYLYAKVGNRKLKCKVVCKVSNSNSSSNKTKFDASKAKTNITKERFTLNGRIYVKLHSNYDVATDVTITCNFCDSSGQILDYATDTVPCFEKGRTIYSSFADSSKNYDKIEILYNYREAFWKPIASSVSLTHRLIPAADEYDEAYIMATLTNGSKLDLMFADVSFVYYDSYGNVIAIEDEIFMSVPSGSSDSEKVYSPYDANYNNIKFDHYECFVSYAYGY